MSDAYKCDRCKNYYEPYNAKLHIMSGTKLVDLCPQCEDTLKIWLKEYNGQEETADE